MRFYTIHERPAQTAGGDAEVLAIASGFRWWAAIAPIVWLLWHRLWLGVALYLLFSVALGVAFALGDVAEPAATAIGLAVSLLIGLGAADYWRWTLERRGWRLVAVLRVDAAVDAEDLYIRSRGAGSSAAVSVAPLPQTFPPAMPPSARGNEAFPRLL
ncbi:DUF2628 domain-containing protein [Ferrovibrio terrae]|uniref:DUF2628 domain-containing protein n=1 Tax=Ferrovibrio terrae TaxID=2594003 RepID=A0A516GZD9_9PROT|nr:DUF2628 domain-containing protein [Ferrovibrio terrae]QDO96889.1 DUF2628 domain-containing protein [Ferrovibrio terrae]